MYKELILELEVDIKNRIDEYKTKIEVLESYIIPTFSKMIGKKNTNRVINKINEIIPAKNEYSIYHNKSECRPSWITINISKRDISCYRCHIAAFTIDDDDIITDKIIAELNKSLEHLKLSLSRIENVSAKYIVERSYNLYNERQKIESEINKIKSLTSGMKTRLPIH